MRYDWMGKKGSRAKTPRRKDKNSLSQSAQRTQRRVKKLKIFDRKMERESL